MSKDLDFQALSDIIEVSKGRKLGDLLLKNCRIVNVFTETIEENDVLIQNGIIVGVGRYKSAREIIDVNCSFVSPSFIDSHLHIESSMLIPPEFAKSVIPLGTTTVVADPHEIANVSGISGLQFMINSSKNLPMDIFFMLSSCVPATSLETSGAHLYAEDLQMLKNNEKVLGLAELMNYQGVIAEDKEVLDKILMFRDRIIDGHSPGLGGDNLNVYLSSGVMSDHECTNAEEALEKLSKGMWIMMREGSLTRDVLRLLPILNEKTKHRILLCTDDKHPEDLIGEGHINFAISLLVDNNIPLPLAIRLATLNPSLFFGFKRKGGIAPGYIADIVIFNELKNIEKVFKDGVMVAKNGKPLFEISNPVHDYAVKNTINLKQVTFEKLLIQQNNGKIRVIGIRPFSVVTDELLYDPKVVEGYVVSDIERDLIKIAVFERHKATGRVATGFIHGLGLKCGAFATSIAHDSHNIIAAGENDKDILLAVAQIEAMGGGIAIAKDGKIIGFLPLPYGGLMTNTDVHQVAENLTSLHKIAKEENFVSAGDPFMTLAFMSLPVIPKLKITDMGLVDVDKFDFVPLFVSE